MNFWKRLFGTKETPPQNVTTLETAQAAPRAPVLKRPEPTPNQYMFRGLDLSPISARTMSFEQAAKQCPGLVKYSDQGDSIKAAIGKDYSFYFSFKKTGGLNGACVNADNKPDFLGMDSAQPESVWSQLGYKLVNTDRISPTLKKEIWSNGDANIEACKDNNRLVEVRYKINEKPVGQALQPPVATPASETRMPPTRIVLPDHPLFGACGVRGDMVEVQSLLTRGVNIGVVDQDGLTALHHSAVFGRVDISDALLKAGAEINARASDGSTPLFDAAKNGHVDEVAFLLSQGAALNVGCNDGGTPLIVASEHGHAEVVRHLLAARADPNACMKNLVSPLYVASQNGHAGIVTQLLTAGAVVDSADDESMTPMLVACGNGQEQVVGLLLAAKANPNAKDKYGNTPRSIAAKYGRTNIVRLLQSA